MTSALKLSFIIEAIDKATAPMRAVNARIEAGLEPVRKIHTAFNQLLQESHLPRLATQAELVMQRVGGVSSAVRGLAGAVFAVAGAGGASAAVWSGIRHVIEGGAAIYDTARALGLTAQEFSRIAYVLTLDGGSVEDAANSLKFLQRNAVSALSGNREMAIWFRRAGISAQFLKANLNNPVELLNKMADAVEKLPNVAMATDLTMATMGRGGNRLINTLRRGRDGIKEMADEGERLKGALGSGTAAALKETEENLRKMDVAIGGVWKTIAVAALPAVNKIASSFQAWAVANRQLIATKASEFAERLLESLPRIIDTTWRIVSALAAMIAIADRVVQFVGGWDVVFEAWAALLGFRLVSAIFSVGSALVGMIPIIFEVGAALLATPIGWFLGAVALLAAAAYLIYKNWKPIKEFFIDLWEGVKKAILQLDAITPEWIKKFTLPGQLLSFTANAVRPADVAAPGGAPGGSSNVNVGGRLTIKIDQDGRARVANARNENPGVDWDIDSGLMFGARG